MLFQPSMSRGSSWEPLLMPALLTRMSTLPYLSERRLDCGFPGLGAGDVGVDVDGLAAGVFDLAGDGLALVVEYVGYDDLGALAGEQAGFLGAHATGGSRDYRDFAFQSHLETSVKGRQFGSVSVVAHIAVDVDGSDPARVSDSDVLPDRLEGRKSVGQRRPKRR